MSILGTGRRGPTAPPTGGQWARQFPSGREGRPEWAWTPSWGAPAAGKAAASAAPAAAAPEIAQGGGTALGSTAGGSDVAYTGGDANALQDETTMARRRNAASQRLALLG